MDINLKKVNYSVIHNADSNILFIFAPSNFKCYKAMSDLQVQVFLNHQAKLDGKKLFEKIVNISDSINVDFACIIKALRFLFGSKAIVSFNLF